MRTYVDQHEPISSGAVLMPALSKASLLFMSDLLDLQALAADDPSIVQRGNQLLPGLATFRPVTAARVLTQPLLQLLAPAVMHCLQQQQEGCSDAVEQFGVRVTGQQAAQLVLAEGFLGVLCTVVVGDKEYFQGEHRT
jgi:hypothetical protein